MKPWLGFGDIALIFKVTVEPYTFRSNLSVCGRGTSVFSVK